jgi:hypothetical protein
MEIIQPINAYFLVTVLHMNFMHLLQGTEYQLTPIEIYAILEMDFNIVMGKDTAKGTIFRFSALKRVPIHTPHCPPINSTFGNRSRKCPWNCDQPAWKPSKKCSLTDM